MPADGPVRRGSVAVQVPELAGSMMVSLSWGGTHGASRRGWGVALLPTLQCGPGLAALRTPISHNSVAPRYPGALHFSPFRLGLCAVCVMGEAPESERNDRQLEMGMEAETHKRAATEPPAHSWKGSCGDGAQVLWCAG